MIKHMISPGIGFTPGSVKFIVTRGLAQGVSAASTRITYIATGSRTGTPTSDRTTEIGSMDRTSEAEP